MRFMKSLKRKIGMARETEEEIEIAVLEALATAVIHGNNENPEKQVHLTCRCSMDGEVSIVVRDEGGGFDSQAVPDPTELQGLLLSHGRGLHLMRTLMDEGSFAENGTVVRLRSQMKPSDARYP